VQGTTASSDPEERMQTVMIQAPAEDAAFFEELRQKGVNVEVIEVERFEGLSEVIQAVVTLTAAVTPLLIAYFKENTARAKNRMVIVDGKKIYSAAPQCNDGITAAYAQTSAEKASRP
jgi:hypothetical protein